MKLKVRILSLFCLCVQIAAQSAIPQTFKTYLNSNRGFEPFASGSPHGLVLENLTDSLIFDYIAFPEDTFEASIEFRARNANGDPVKRHPYLNSDGKKNYIRNPFWGFFLTTEADTLIVTIREIEKEMNPDMVPCAEIKVYDSEHNLMLEKNFFKELNPYDGDNIWHLAFQKGYIEVNGGAVSLSPLFSISSVGRNLEKFGFISAWGSKLIVDDILFEYSSVAEESNKDFSLEELSEYLERSVDPLEGYWTLYDRDLEESLLKLGGQYSLAAVRDGDDYIFLYLDGASVNKKEWTPGDVKIILHPSPFPGLFDVEWFDSLKEKMWHEIKGQRGEGDTITIQFPYQSSKIRLRRIP